MVQDVRPSGAPFKRLFFALPVSDAQRRALAQWRRGLNLRSGNSGGIIPRRIWNPTDAAIAVTALATGMLIIWASSTALEIQP